MKWQLKWCSLMCRHMQSTSTLIQILTLIKPTKPWKVTSTALHFLRQVALGNVVSSSGAYVCMCMYINVYVYVCTCICMYGCVWVHAWHVYVCSKQATFSYICVYLYLYVYLYIFLLLSVQEKDRTTTLTDLSPCHVGMVWCNSYEMLVSILVIKLLILVQQSLVWWSCITFHVCYM